MSDIIELGEPDVIRNEDNILWLRAEIERLTAKDETNSRLMYEQAKALDKLLAELKQANAVVETAKIYLTAMQNVALGSPQLRLPEMQMIRLSKALTAIEKYEGIS